MNKTILYMLLFIFISGAIVTVFSSSSVSGLVQDSWSTKKPLPQARANLGVATIEGKIYAIGGYTTISQGRRVSYQAGFVGTNERYDPATDKWVTLEPMPTPRANFAIAAYQGKIYCIGGEILHKLGDYHIYKVTEVYDPVTDSWSTKKDIPFKGLGFKLYVVNDQLFAIVGHELFTYNSITDEWTKKTSIPLPDDAHANSGIVFDLAVVLDNKIMVYFTYVDNVDSWLAKGAVMIYDTEADVWRAGRTHTDGIYGPSTQSPYGTTVSVTGVCITTGIYAPVRVYIFGLTSGPGQPISTNWVYEPEKDTWSTANNMPTYREQFGVAVVDDILYVIGGKNAFGSDIYSVNEQHVPKGYKGALPPIATKPSVTTTPEPANTTPPPPRPPTSFIPRPPTTKPFLNPQNIAIVIIITVSTIVAGLFIYFNKEKKYHLT